MQNQSSSLEEIRGIKMKLKILLKHPQAVIMKIRLKTGDFFKVWNNGCKIIK